MPARKTTKKKKAAKKAYKLQNKNTRNLMKKVEGMYPKKKK